MSAKIEYLKNLMWDPNDWTVILKDEYDLLKEKDVAGVNLIEIKDRLGKKEFGEGAAVAKITFLEKHAGTVPAEVVAEKPVPDVPLKVVPTVPNKVVPETLQKVVDASPNIEVVTSAPIEEEELEPHVKVRIAKLISFGFVVDKEDNTKLTHSLGETITHQQLDDFKNEDWTDILKKYESLKFAKPGQEQALLDAQQRQKERREAPLEKVDANLPSAEEIEAQRLKDETARKLENRIKVFKDAGFSPNEDIKEIPFGGVSLLFSDLQKMTDEEFDSTLNYALEKFTPEQVEDMDYSFLNKLVEQDKQIAEAKAKEKLDKLNKAKAEALNIIAGFDFSDSQLAQHEEYMSNAESLKAVSELLEKAKAQSEEVVDLAKETLARRTALHALGFKEDPRNEEVIFNPNGDGVTYQQLHDIEEENFKRILATWAEKKSERDKLEKEVDLPKDQSNKIEPDMNNHIGSSPVSTSNIFTKKLEERREAELNKDSEQIADEYFEKEELDVSARKGWKPTRTIESILRDVAKMYDNVQPEGGYQGLRDEIENILEGDHDGILHYEMIEVKSTSGFFSRLGQMKFEDLSLNVIKMNNGTLTVTAKPKNTSGDAALDSMRSLVFNGTPEDLDKGFFDGLITPLETFHGVVVNNKSFLEDLAEAEAKTKLAEVNKKNVESLVAKAQKYHDDKDFDASKTVSVSTATKKWNSVLELDPKNSLALAGIEKLKEQEQEAGAKLKL